jgi:hypothetical protein
LTNRKAKSTSKRWPLPNHLKALHPDKENLHVTRIFFKNLLLYEFLYVRIWCGQHNHGSIPHYFSHYCFYYNSCSLISAIKKGENDWLLLKCFGIIALAPFFLCRDVMLLGDLEEVTFWRLIWLFCWSKAKFLVIIYLRLNALLCMSQEYFLPPAMITPLMKLNNNCWDLI